MLQEKELYNKGFATEQQLGKIRSTRIVQVACDRKSSNCFKGKALAGTSEKSLPERLSVSLPALTFYALALFFVRLDQCRDKMARN